MNRTVSLLCASALSSVLAILAAEARASCEQEISEYCTASGGGADCVASAKRVDRSPRKEWNERVAKAEARLREGTGDTPAIQQVFRTEIALFRCLSGGGAGEKGNADSGRPTSATKEPHQDSPNSLPQAKSPPTPPAVPDQRPKTDQCADMQRPQASDIAGNRKYCECGGDKRFALTSSGWRCQSTSGSYFYGCTQTGGTWSCIAN